MQNAINILFVNYDSNIGGGQTNLLTILRHLDRRKFNPVIICCLEGFFTETLKREGYNPFIMDFGKGRVRYLHKSLPAIIRIFRFIRKEKIQIVHANSFNAFKITAIAAKLAGVPAIWYEAP